MVFYFPIHLLSAVTVVVLPAPRGPKMMVSGWPQSISVDKKRLKPVFTASVFLCDNFFSRFILLRLKKRICKTLISDVFFPVRFFSLGNKKGE